MFRHVLIDKSDKENSWVTGLRRDRAQGPGAKAVRSPNLGKAPKKGFIWYNYTKCGRMGSGGPKLL